MFMYSKQTSALMDVNLGFDLFTIARKSVLPLPWEATQRRSPREGLGKEVHLLPMDEPSQDLSYSGAAVSQE